MYSIFGILKHRIYNFHVFVLVVFFSLTNEDYFLRIFSTFLFLCEQRVDYDFNFCNTIIN